MSRWVHVSAPVRVQLQCLEQVRGRVQCCVVRWIQCDIPLQLPLHQLRLQHMQKTLDTL